MERRLLFVSSLLGLVCGRQREVVCDRETDYYYWWMTSTEYFTCQPTEKCCGDAWSRHCCDKRGMDDGLIIGLAILFSILTLALICFIISLYHYKKKTKHYHSAVHWYGNLRPNKTDSAPLGGGGWNVGKTANPNIQGNVDVVPTVTAQVNIDGPAQPYMPGPAIYQPPMIS